VFAVFGVIYNVVRSAPRIAPPRCHRESVNNPLRFLSAGSRSLPQIAPPVSILLAYWFGGAFLMTAKRVSEHRAIVEAGAPRACGYRPSFAVYTHSSLVTSCLVYAQGFAVHDGDLPAQYRIEYLSSFPLFIACCSLYAAA